MQEMVRLEVTTLNLRQHRGGECIGQRKMKLKTDIGKDTQRLFVDRHNLAPPSRGDDAGANHMLERS